MGCESVNAIPAARCVKIGCVAKIPVISCAKERKFSWGASFTEINRKKLPRTSIRPLLLARSRMGTWAAGTFDNDTACDWAGDLHRVQDLSLVKTAIARVCSVDAGNLDSELAVEALAACEVLARLQGHWGLRDSYSEPVDKWVEAHPMQIPAGLVEQAIQAIDRILQPGSELLELWEEGDDGEWHQAVADLKKRVRGQEK